MSIEESLSDALKDVSFPVELAVLFGSFARGQTRTDSDVDIGIGWCADASAEDRMRVCNALERIAHRTVDFVDLDGAPPQLRFEIARDGRVLAARRPEAWFDFRARAMIDWWDFGPVASVMHAGAVRRLRERVPSGAR